MKCCICSEEIAKQGNGWEHGHNADPVADGRCCDVCNTMSVIPARLKRMPKNKAEVRDGNW
jgi:hypothetical protein